MKATAFVAKTVWLAGAMAFAAIMAVNAAAAGAERAPIYPMGADANKDVQAALERAKAADKRVLIQYGANWCGWCYKLHDLFAEDEAVRDVLTRHFEVVLVNTDENKAYAKAMGTDIQGIPFLTVLNADGSKLTDQPTGPLEIGSQHDPNKVLAFLNTWKGDAADATEVFERALSSIKGSEKQLFVHFGAPWCGWCRRLDALLADEAFHKVFRKQFVEVKIDRDNMQNAVALQERLKSQPKGGIPWYAVVDASGQTVATSESKDGNTGYPAADAEIAHFMDVLRKAGSAFDSADLVAMENRLRALNSKR